MADRRRSDPREAIDLLGERVVWASSEGNRGFADLHDGLFWNTDRLGRDELSYARVKMMLYLDPMSLANGALRVIRGSHRSPLHDSLLPFYASRKSKESRYFGLRGADVPVPRGGRPARLRPLAVPRPVRLRPARPALLGSSMRPSRATTCRPSGRCVIWAATCGPRRPSSTATGPRIRAMIAVRVESRPWHQHDYAMPPEYR